MNVATAVSTRAQRALAVTLALILVPLLVAMPAASQSPGADSQGEPKEVTIAEARALPMGTLVRITGVVTRAEGAFTYMQDETAGITIRQTSGSWFDDVADGTIDGGRTVEVEGVTSQFRGLIQINEGDLQAYTLLVQGILPEPIILTLSDIAANGETYEARLVHVVNLVFEDDGSFSPATTYAISDPTLEPGGVDFRIPNANDTELDGNPIPDGLAAFTGVVGQFWPTPTGPVDEGYQLMGIWQKDLASQPFVLSLAQIVHNAPDPALAEVDVYVNGLLALQDFPFRDATPFNHLPSAVTIAVAPADSEGPDDAFYSESFILLPETVYQLTAIGVGEGDFPENPDGIDIGFDLASIEDAQQAATDTGFVDVAVMHATPDAGYIQIVDFTSMPHIIFEGVYRDQTDYMALAPAPYMLTVEVGTGSDTEIFTFEADFSGLAGKAFVLQTTGFLNPALQPDDDEGFGLLAVFAEGTTLFYAPFEVSTEPGVDAREFVVEGNHPNPFSSRTAIRYDLPVDGLVHLQVYDVLGRRVLETPREPVDAGTGHMLSIDAGALAAGTYLWRLIVDSGGATLTETGRMTIVR